MPTCFVMMPFDEKFTPVYEQAIRPAIAALTSHRLDCVRADKILAAGIVAEQIRKAIHDAAICVADLTGNNPNVIYEVALAHEANKPVILLTQDPPEKLPFDIRHFRAISYRIESLPALADDLTRSLAVEVKLGEPPVRLIQEMLAPASLGPEPGPFVVAACPLPYRGAMRPGGGFKTLHPTESDHVGIRGLIQAFGLIYGVDRLPELLDPDDYDDVVLETSMNAYCIGSPKANRWTGLLQERFFKHWLPVVEFKADPSSTDLKRITVGVCIDGQPYVQSGLPTWPSSHRGFGLVIRGPHPADAGRMLMILAGPGRTGTEAACRAVTEAKYVLQVKQHLGEHVTLDNHRIPFCVAVSMKRPQDGNGGVDPESFEVDRVIPLKASQRDAR